MNLKTEAHYGLHIKLCHVECGLCFSSVVEIVCMFFQSRQNCWSVDMHGSKMNQDEVMLYMDHYMDQ